MTQRSQSRRSGGFFRTLWRVIRQLFHETTGSAFVLLALFWTLAGIRQWRHGAATWTWVAFGSFALLLGSFGVSSFLASRRVR
jgi:hypothetical protein